MDTAVTPERGDRLVTIDLLRGLIMAAMALDHARAFIARDHPFEAWNAPLPVYTEVLPFLTRFVTHFCAPGFFLLMGAGMTLFAATRSKSGWSTARITRYFVTRGVLLFLVSMLIENPAWVIGMMGGANNASPDPDMVPSPDSGPALPLGVLYALSASMICWSPLVRAPGWLIGALSVSAILLTQAWTPSLGEAGASFSPLTRMLLVPGRSGPLFVIYPLIAWTGLGGLGILFGRLLSAEPERAALWALRFGVVALLIFTVTRLAGGFGNIHVPPQAGIIGFLNVTKYPPSLAFIALTLGVDLLLFGLIRWVCDSPGQSRRVADGNPILVFGRVALFFYIAHLYVFAFIGLAFPHGAAVATVYPLWLLGLAILYPMSQTYLRFKSAKPADSLWRFF